MPKPSHALSSSKTKKRAPRGVVVDLFCGVGGLSHGFRLEGFEVAAGIDLDEHCRYPYEKNNQAPFIRRDINTVDAKYLGAMFAPEQPSVLVGCAPCQPFSQYNAKNDDPKWRLVGKFAGLIRDLKPDIVSMENVPRLLEFRRGEVFKRFRRTLEAAGYSTWHDVVYAPDYGVPQRRSRLVFLASLHGPIALEPGALSKDEYVTVRDAIGKLPRIRAGGICRSDPMHRSSTLSPTNIRRIRASKPGGSWRGWKSTLVADCHKVETGKGYGSVYGRMRYDEPSPTITTQFYGFGNGRFGHPTQDRALSLREGAILQSFPRDYAFAAPGDALSLKSLGRLIGNAVPVRLAQAIARSIRAHIEEHNL